MTVNTLKQAQALHTKIGELAKQYTKRLARLFNKNQLPEQDLTDLGSEIFALLSLSTELMGILNNGDQPDYELFLEELEEHTALKSVRRDPPLRFPPHRPRRVLWMKSRSLYNKFHTFVANA